MDERTALKRLKKDKIKKLGVEIMIKK